jgi:hypothetical protein
MFFLQDFRGSPNHLRRRERQIPSPPQAVQRETATDTIDPVVSVDIPRDFTVGHKKVCLDLTKSARGRKTCS